MSETKRDKWQKGTSDNEWLSDMMMSDLTTSNVKWCDDDWWQWQRASTDLHSTISIYDETTLTIFPIIPLEVGDH